MRKSVTRFMPGHPRRRRRGFADNGDRGREQTLLPLRPSEQGREPTAKSETRAGRRSPSADRSTRRQDAPLEGARIKEHASVLVICATIEGQAVVPLLGGKGHCTGRQTTSHKLWRYGTTKVCCSGWRSPLLTGGASLVRIFLLPRVP